jgi:uncharacterized membrane protein YkvI
LNTGSLLRAYLIPAAVFQGVIVGGGYGTGREIVEYLSRHGPLGGLVAAGVIAGAFALILAVAFAFAHHFRIRDYRHFVKALLGPAWVAYEVLFVVLLVIVLAVIGSAAGQVLDDGFDVPFAGGVSAVFIAVVVLNFFGRELVERSLFAWTVLLMLGLVSLIVFVVSTEMNAVSESFAGYGTVGNAAISGFKFALYNSAVIPVLIYCVEGIQTRREAFYSGAIAGVFGAIPAVMLHLAFMSRYPQIVEQSLPTYWLLALTAGPTATYLYFVILFGTIVLTAVGVLQGVNERLDGWRADRGRAPFSREWHAAAAGGLLAISMLLARFGIVDLVARGYGTLAWGFFLVFTLPLLTIGSFKLIRPDCA